MIEENKEWEACSTATGLFHRQHRGGQGYSCRRKSGERLSQEGGPGYAFGKTNCSGGGRRLGANRSQIPGKFYYKRKGKVGQGRISAPPRAVLMSPFSSENAVVLQPRTTRFSSWEGWRVEGMRVGVEVPAAASQAGVGFLLNLPTPSESPFSIESPAAPDSDRVLFVTPSFFH